MDKNTTFDKKLDSRANFPRFTKEVLEANQVVIESKKELEEINIALGKLTIMGDRYQKDSDMAKSVGL